VWQHNGLLLTRTFYCRENLDPRTNKRLSSSEGKKPSRPRAAEERVIGDKVDIRGGSDKINQSIKRRKTVRADFSQEEEIDTGTVAHIARIQDYCFFSHRKGEDLNLRGNGGSAC